MLVSFGMELSALQHGVHNSISATWDPSPGIDTFAKCVHGFKELRFDALNSFLYAVLQISSYFLFS